MSKFIIDANLPYYFSIWNSSDYVHLKDINDSWTDEQLWEYAKENNLTIITKDSDFSNRILFNDPPPRIIHIRFGNLKMKEFYEILNKVWEKVCNLSEVYKLVNVFREHIEGIN
jgi:predicted nuclease of predicted toxin-antitoxin system